jgi:dTDP-4-amino-4,6-dideoxygalactose transaminase
LRLLWRQLPAHSPAPFAAAWEAVGHGLGLRDDARPRLRETIQAIYAADEAILLGSGEQALEVAIRAAASIVGGDPVVALPAFTCFDVAAAAVGAGTRIALYDVEPSTLAPDLESLATTLAEGARIVVVAPLYGNPIDWQTLEERTAGFGGVVIEDAAQGHGAFWRDRLLGSFGVLSTLSFGRGKGWTGGKGGALLVRSRGRQRLSLPTGGAGDPRSGVGTWAELGVLLRAVAQWALGHPSRFRLPTSLPWLGLGETRYHDPQPPTGMTRTAAALLEHTRWLAAREALIRRANAQWLLDHLPARPQVRAVCPPTGSAPGYLRLALRASRGLAGFGDGSRAVRLGVMRSYPSTLAALPQVAARLVRVTGRWPGAEELVRTLVTLPTHSLLTEGDREALAKMLADYAG